MVKHLLITVLCLLSSFCFAQEDDVVLDRSYRDYFSQVSDFDLSFLRYRYRGYDARYEEYRINGVEFKNLDNDAPMWSGMVGFGSSNKEFTFYRGVDFDASGSNLGGIGGVDYVKYKEVTERQFRVNASLSNRAYSYRLGGQYSNVWKNGLSATVEASRRWGRSLAVEGVWSDAWTLAGNVNKILDSKNSIDFNLIFTPNQRSTQRFSVEEAFDLTQNRYYNPNWGWQNGKIRSARSRGSILPISTLQHTHLFDQKSSIKTTLGIAVGQQSYNTLNWQNAPNPNPDYYKNLPSFQTDPVAKKELEKLWKSNQNVNQINYEKIYQINAQDQAHYIDEQRVSNITKVVIQSVYQTKFKNNFAFSAGVEASYDNELRYKKLEDLMGAQYWLDIDYFLESEDDYRELTQNNVRNPNRHIKVGDRFGHNYTLQRFKSGVWSAMEYTNDKWLFRVGANVGYQALSRIGHYEKENFPNDQSFGKSKTLNSFEYRIKAAVEYRLGSNFSTSFTLASMSLPQTVRNSFLDPNYRNSFVENLSNEQILSGQLAARYSSSKFRGNFAVYTTEIRNSTEVYHYYDDLRSVYSDYIVNDIDKVFIGAELSFEVQIYGPLWLNFATSISRNYYRNNAIATQYNQTTGALIDQDDIEWRNKMVPLSPQAVGNIGLTYNSFGWMASIKFNAFSGNYVALAPNRYATRALFDAKNQVQMREQEQLPSGFSLDISGGKTFELRDYSRIGIYAGISNLTNNHIQTAGYQSNRVLKDKNNQYSPMASKFYYGIGINFYVTATYTF